ncbi:MAG TPA: hypothetical protein VN538_03440 [Clostridia bacterium]|nr:hypothetical protein [Clostridia bacterium]
MSLSDDQIQKIIARAQNSMHAAQNACAALAADEDSVLVLVPGFVPAPARALAALTAQYGENLQLVFLGDAQFPLDGTMGCRMDWATQQNELVELLVRAEHAVLLTPGTALLARMGAGKNGEDFSEALVRRILWGKAMDVLLDFEPPKFRRDTYFAKLAEAIDQLSSMGFRFSTYQPCEGGTGNVLALVTEREVVEAKQSGRKTILCAAGAIVTPLAVDTAKELQIHIERAQV